MGLPAININASKTAHRIIPVWLVLDSDGKSPATAEAGGQPVISINNGAAVNSVNTLVAVVAIWGAYALVLDQTEVANLAPQDRVRVLYKGGTTSVFDETFTADVSPYVLDGTLAAGSTTTATLPAGASATDDAYKGMFLYAYAGTGAGQGAEIASYVGSTKVATFAAAVPGFDATTRFVLIPSPRVLDLPQAVWDKQKSALTSAGSIGQWLASIALDGSGNVTVGTIIPAVLTAIRTELENAGTKLDTAYARITAAIASDGSLLANATTAIKNAIEGTGTLLKGVSDRVVAFLANTGALTTAGSNAVRDAANAAPLLVSVDGKLPSDTPTRLAHLDQDITAIPTGGGSGSGGLTVAEHDTLVAAANSAQAAADAAVVAAGAATSADGKLPDDTAQRLTDIKAAIDGADELAAAAVIAHPDFKKLKAHVAGKFSRTPRTGTPGTETITLFAEDGTTPALTITLTYNADGEITQRVVA